MFNRSLRWIAALAIVAASPAQAANPTLDNITQADFENIVDELSANFAYSTVTPASSLGSVWGLEFGVAGGVTNVPKTHAIVKREAPNTEFKDIFPHGTPLARITAPLGLTGEVLLLPRQSISDVKFKQTGGALMWTITDVFFEDLPVHWAVKGFYNKVDVSFTQNVTPISGGPQVPGTIRFEDEIYGLQTLISKKFLVFEPYLGLGWLKSKATVGVSASVPASIFNSAFTAGSSAAADPSSAQFLGGLDIRLAFLSLGAEYQRSFGTDRYTGRLSFRF